ncbi:MAG: sodium:solute symporter family protein [Bryobacteraceae bacterium]
MALTTLDWIVILLYFAVNIGIGFYYRSRAGESLDEYFLSGRNIPWWLAGTSMVATTFAADTPLAVTGLVARGGIAGNWLWWNFLAGGLLTVFFYARLWRRSGVMTDIEFSEIRYSGRPAAFLRGFRAIYLSIPIGCIVLGWVNLAMVKIIRMILGVDKTTALLYVMGLVVITALISTVSGLWGVLVTDSLQFVIKLSMVIVLAFASVSAVGGIGALKAKLIETGRSSALDFAPDLNSPLTPFLTFCVYIGVVWWSTWYPGAEPGGGGFVAQRMLCARDEKHSLLATFWFNLAHFAIRPWPWILTALAAVVLYPELTKPGGDPESGYVRIMIDHLPSYFRGLMVAGFIAAFMSTNATQLNWGAAYLVNDFYRRFWKRDGSERHYVNASQVATVVLTIISAVVTFYMDSVSGAWKLLMATGAGTGGVLLARWYWWRVNAWSEVTAMVVSFLVSIALQTVGGYDTDKPLDFAWVMIITTAVSTVAWVAVTLASKPEPDAVLDSFYRRTRPAFGWGPVAERVRDVQPAHDTAANLACWIAGCVFIYGALFGVGKLIFGETALGLGILVVSIASVPTSIATFRSGVGVRRLSDGRALVGQALACAGLLVPLSRAVRDCGGTEVPRRLKPAPHSHARVFARAGRR